MTSKGIVLITGANGYIAARTVESFLQAGYTVRGTVRSVASSAGLVAALSQYGSRLSIVAVPDITAPHAFDSAVRGVDAIAHLAAPVSMSFTDPVPVLRDAVEGTARVFESAAREDSVKSFVFMSSTAAMSQPSTEEDTVITDKDWNDWAEAVVAKLGKDTPSPVIYSASKAAAEKAFWKFREDKKPKFSMTAINPTYVAGPPLVPPTSADKVGETISPIWRVLRGEDLATTAMPGFAGCVDVRDVGRLVVFGVEHPDVANGQRYIAASAYGPPQAIADILRETYPERRGLIQEGKPGEGYEIGYDFPKKLVYDGNKTVRNTGVEWTPFYKTVVDTARSLEKLL